MRKFQNIGLGSALGQNVFTLKCCSLLSNKQSLDLRETHPGDSAKRTVCVLEPFRTHTSALISFFISKTLGLSKLPKMPPQSQVYLRSNSPVAPKRLAAVDDERTSLECCGSRLANEGRVAPQKSTTRRALPHQLQHCRDQTSRPQAVHISRPTYIFFTSRFCLEGSGNAGNWEVSGCR